MTDAQILEEYSDFSKADKEKYIKANGWNTLWHEDNWVHKDAKNPDWAGHSVDQAFCATIRKAGIVRDGH